MTERRYSEEEVAQIIEAAARRPDRLTDSNPRKGTTEGFSLAEVQEIGGEVGLSQEAIAASAAALDVAASPVAITGTTMGIPHGVAGAVPLPRELTDREWAVLVGHLRETFNAHGVVEAQGMVRSWRNGNLQFRIEPVSGGTVLRMRTHKSDAQVLPGMGGGMAGLGAALAGILPFAGEPKAAVVFGATFIPLGLMMLGTGIMTVPKWARERKAQMEALAAYVLQMTSRPSLEAAPEVAPDALPEGSPQE